jgi:hypothetical protein
LCGSEGFKDTGEVKWICPYQKPYDYWVLLDKDGKQIKSYYYNEKPQTGEGQTVELRSYFGCPAFNKKARETE